MTTPATDNPRFLITDDDFNPVGAVVIDDGRWIGHDTAGRQFFNRQDMAGAELAAKRHGRLIARGYYGVDTATNDKPAPDEMRRRDAMRRARSAR